MIYVLCFISLEIELGKLDERLVQILAWQRLQQLLPPKPGSTPAPAATAAAHSPSSSNTTTTTSLATNQTSAATMTTSQTCVATSNKKPVSSSTVQPVHTGEKLALLIYN